jgi:hypothetical protein
LFPDIRYKKLSESQILFADVTTNGISLCFNLS